MRKLPKVSVFIATSLDGFIARKDGRIDWLEQANATLPPGEDCGYAAFFDSVDTLVMGRKTFETVLSFDSWPFNNKRVIVLSSKLKAVPERVSGLAAVACAEPMKILSDLADQGAKHIYLDGGVTIQRFLMHNLIDEITLTRIPVILGEGVSLFAPVANDVMLRHKKTQTYLNGFIQSTYEVDRNT